MENIQSKCLQTTRHIADKILMLRRANKLTQEQFAEKVGLDRRTIARAEDGKTRPSSVTMEIIANVFCIPISYFFVFFTYQIDVGKIALIYQINSKLNVMSKSNLKKVNSFIDLIE